MKFSSIFSGILILVLLDIECSKDSMVGPSTESGNPQIVAVVLGADELPAQSVSVTAYRNSLTKDTMAAPSGAFSVATSLTDNKGKCTFGKLPPGVYTIEATDSRQGNKAMVSGLIIDRADTQVRDTLHLSNPGMMRGVVSRGGIKGQSSLVNNVLGDGGIMVIIQEIEAAPRNTAQDGRYQFSSMSPGTYTLLFYAADGFYSARRTVVVNPGDTTEIDLVILKPLAIYPPRGFSVSTHEVVSSDPLPIVKLTWNRVVFDSLRWYEVERIDIAGSLDKTITTTDTLYSDTLVSIPSGTTLNYVVRSVDRAFNRSYNAGPLEVVIK